MTEQELKQLREQRKKLIDEAATCDWMMLGEIDDKLNEIDAKIKAAGESIFDEDEILSDMGDAKNAARFGSSL